MITHTPLKAIFSTRFAVASAALSLSGFASADTLLEDNFDDDSLDAALWKVDTTIPQGGAAVTEQNQRIELLARGHLVTVEQFDPVALGGIRITGQWTFVSGDDFMQVLTRSDGLPNPLNCCGETANGIEFFVALTNAVKTVEIRTRDGASIGLNQDTAGIITAGANMTFDFEIIDNGSGGLSFTMTEVGNPANAATTTATVVSDNFDLNHVAFHNREGGRTAYLDNVLIATIEDSDGDGLPDDWETANNLDPDDNGEDPNNNGVAGDPDQGTDGDPDNDLSTNLDEFVRGTDPQDDDSDDDTLLDGVETGTSIWASVTDTGTNPLIEDTDGDTLRDDVENPDLAFDPANPGVQPGTDPNLRDTDGDDFPDGIELDEGTDPTDALSFPAVGGALPLADDFDDDFLNPLLWTSNLVIPQGGASVSEQNQRIELVARGHLVTVQQFDPVTLGGIRITGQWTFVSGDDFMQVLTRTDGLPAGQYGETANGIEFNVALTDADKDLQILSRSGAIAVTQDVVGIITAAAGMTFDFEIVDDGIGGLSFTMTEVGNEANTATTTATVDSDDFNLNYVAFHNRESAARTAYLDNVSITSLVSDPIQFTDFSYDPATNSVSLSWTSTENRSYTVFASENLISIGLEIDDGYPADPGDTTTYTFISPLPAPPATSRLFFRVRENPAP